MVPGVAAPHVHPVLAIARRGPADGRAASDVDRGVVELPQLPSHGGVVDVGPDVDEDYAREPPGGDEGQPGQAETPERAP